MPNPPPRFGPRIRISTSEIYRRKNYMRVIVLGQAGLNTLSYVTVVQNLFEFGQSRVPAAPYSGELIKMLYYKTIGAMQADDLHMTLYSSNLGRTLAKLERVGQR